jgi:hypothetical protein
MRTLHHITRARFAVPTPREVSQVGSRLEDAFVLGVEWTDTRSSGTIIGNWASVACARCG